MSFATLLENRKRRNELLRELLDLEVEDGAILQTVVREEKFPSDRLNLRFPGMAIFESGGCVAAATTLSKTERQIVVALRDAGSSGLDMDGLVEKVDVWSEETDEGSVKVLVSRINRKFLDAEIPFQIESRRLEISRRNRTQTEKFHFLVAVRLSPEINRPKKLFGER